TGVRLSIDASTEPVLVPVVAVLYSADWIGPKRASLPSLFPPPDVEVDTCDAPVLTSAGLPCCSCQATTPKALIRMIPITAPSTIPCLTLPTQRPKVMVRPSGISRQLKISSEFVNPLGFSKGCAELALKNPPPLV